jgi:hypothetical protein
MSCYRSLVLKSAYGIAIVERTAETNNKLVVELRFVVPELCSMMGSETETSGWWL